jgi:hypothetical protein
VFPGNVGSYWVYEGSVRYQGVGTNEAPRRKVRWQMRVDRVYHRADATAIVLSGFPDDVAWPTDNSVSQPSMFIQTSDGRVYRIESQQKETEQKVFDPQVCLQDFLKSEDLWFTLPFKEGNRFCDRDNADRTDGMYCWVVEHPQQLPLPRVKGITRQPITAYPLRFLTNPDDTQITLVPGLGVVRYAYHHHGTIGDTELELVEAHIVSTSQATH